MVTDHSSSGRKVRVVCGCRLPSGVDAVTLGRVVLLRHGAEWAGVLRGHELVHVSQYERLGVPTFLFRYLREYAKARRGGAGHWEAYRSISFEREAYGD